MNTILFAWNPSKWKWTNLSEAVIETNQTGKYFDEWSCVLSKSIKKGDRAFLVKLGQKPKGIIGSGYVVSDVFVTPHWDIKLQQEGKISNKVNIEFDVLSEEPIITEEDLKNEKIRSQVWFPRMSGISINENVAVYLEELWKHKTKQNNDKEVSEISSLYSEGKRVLKKSYLYERNAKARDKCLAHYGYKCYICGFSFMDKYGDIGKGFIHVHHKNPVSEIGHEYTVDPIRDLIPICPNCHAMIHRKVPALSIEELKLIIERNNT